MKNFKEKAKEVFETEVMPQIAKAKLKTFHITYFISRGDLNANDETLLGGVTIKAVNVKEAIDEFEKLEINEINEIKYIVEL